MGKEKKPDTFLGWLGFEDLPTWSRSPKLGSIVGALVLLFVLAMLVGALITSVLFFAALFADHAGVDGSTNARNYAFVIAALVGAPFIVWRAFVVQKQADIAEQGLITDRINKAVEGLGAQKERKFTARSVTYKVKAGERTDEVTEMEHPYATLQIPDDVPDDDITRGPWQEFTETEPNLEVRLGAIYALERISQDSERDHITIMETLCAYIRENAPAASLDPAEPPVGPKRTRIDIQAAISVIGRRDQHLKELERSKKYRLDFRGTDLSHADFSRGDFSAATFHRCRLEAANFDQCDLTGSQFQYALLNFATFWQSVLIGTIFDFAVVNRTVKSFLGSHFLDSAKKIKAISFVGADLSAVRSITPHKLHDETFGSKDTILNGSLDRRRQSLEEKQWEIKDARDNGLFEKADTLENELRSTGFLYWCPFDSNDAMVYLMRADFLKAKGLTDWPHRY